MPIKKNRVVLLDSLTLRDKLTVPTERHFKAGTGQMIAPCVIARVGLMDYRAEDLGELFKDRDPKSIVKVMTTETELFDEKTIASARSAPVTVGHPAEDVTIKNAKTLQKGSIEGLPVRLDDTLTGTVVLNDATAIKVVQEEADELSIGQTCDIKLADEGATWDAEKINIRINHVAIVKKGRAGAARINDGEILYDQAHVDGLQAIVDSQSSKIESQASVITAITTELKDAKEELKTKKDINFSEAVEARMELVLNARMLDSDIETKQKTEHEIKFAALSKVYSGKKDLKDQSEAYISVLFDMAVDDHLEDHGISDVQAVLNKEFNKPSPATTTRIDPKKEARDRMISRHAKEA